MGKFKSAVWSGIITLVSNCAHEPVAAGRPFTNSSLDHNKAQFHQLRVDGELETVADAVVSIMESKGAGLVRRRQSDPHTLVLSFRLAVERVSGSRSTSVGSYAAPARWFRTGFFSSETIQKVDYVAYGAVFYVELETLSHGITMRAIGLPVIDGLTACPPQVSAYRECRPAKASDEAEGFADFVRRTTSISVSGKKEAEVLSGLLAQLQRKRWQETFKASKRDDNSTETPNDNVDSAFDKE